MKRRDVSTWILLGLWTTAIVWFVATTWLIQTQTSQAERLAKELGKVADEVLAGRWVEADQLLSEVRSTWEEIRRRWALHVEHREMDEITDALVEAEAAIRTSDNQAYVQLQRAVDRVRTLPERERLMLQNVW